MNWLPEFRRRSVETKISNPEKLIKNISDLVHSGEKKRIEIFEIGEKHGIHITPVHFYQPIPDTRKISKELFNKTPHYPEVDLREEKQIEMLYRFSKYSNEVDKIPDNPGMDKTQYYFKNDFFGPMDALIYYSIIREFSPKKIIEVGSGFSTMIASQASTLNNASITAIEPYPNEILKNGLPNLKELKKSSVQNVSIDTFKELKENDILFIDSSHTITVGSDVNYLFLHVLPELNPGVLIHVHDFFFPYEYPKEWIIDRKLFWNEMYLVWAFLIGNIKYEILLSNYFLMKNHPDEIFKSFPVLKNKGNGAGSLWLRKK